MLLPFALFWCGIVMLGDFVLFRGFANEVRSLSYVATSGSITRSEVAVSQDSDGDDTFKPDIHYDYTVAGRVYHGNKYSYMPMFDGRRESNRAVADFPAGKPATVFYDASNPEQAVLRRGFSGVEPFFFMFMMPFNLIGFGLLGACFGLFSEEGPLATGGVPIVDNRRQVRARLHAQSPIMAAAGTLLMCSFLGIFLCVFPGFLIGNIVLPTAIVWIGIGYLTLRAYFGTLFEQRQGRGDLVYNPSEGTVECWPLPLEKQSKPELVQVRDIAAIRVVDESTKDSDGDLVVKYGVFLDLRNGSIKLKVFNQPEQARAFAGWLERLLDLQPIEQAETEHEEDWTD